MKRSLISLIFFALTVSPSFVSGFLVSKIGGDSAGAVSGQASSIYWNPAALGLMKGTQLYIDNNLLVRKSSFEPTGSAPGAEAGEKGHSSSFKSQPMLAVVSDLGTERFQLGLGVYAPFGSSSVWEDPNGPQRY